MLVGAALGIAVEAVREILTTHRLLASWTLLVLAGVVVVNWWIARRVLSVGVAIESTAIEADGWHHVSEAVTSAAAFVGISIALWGGPSW